MKKIKIAIVILHYREYDELEKCLNSLKYLKHPSGSVITTVVVDNEYNKQKLKKIKGKFQNIAFLPQRKNTGVPTGFNIGYKYSIDNGANYIVMFSPDLRVNADVFVKLLSTMEHDKKIGMACCKMLSKSFPHRIFFVQGKLDEKTKTTIHVGLGEIDKKQYDHNEENDFLNCPMLIRREVFIKVGYFTDKLFQYYEDTDWHTRIKKAGFKLVCVKNAVAWNLKAEEDVANLVPKKEYYLARNHLWFVHHNFSFIEQSIAFLYTFKDILNIYLSRNIGKNDIRFRYMLLGIKDFLLDHMGKISEN